MNHCVPDWNMEDDSRSLHDMLTTSSQKKSMQPDSELMELLWRNGHVVMHSQTSRKPPAPPKPEPPSKCGGSMGNSNNLLQEDETASWFQYPLDDSLDKEFCSEFFCEMPTASAIATDKPHKDSGGGEGERYVKFGTTQESNNFTMPPPKPHATNSNQQPLSLGVKNFSHFARPMKALEENNGSGSRVMTGMGECSSMRTISSSVCGSNQVVQNHGEGSHTLSKRGAKDGAVRSLLLDRVHNSTFDTAVTSSSGGSGCSFGRTTGQQSGSNNSHKRKGRDAEESECHSEEAEYESVEANKPSQRSASARKSRAAEVHNLSERRRRDRINEKMKALQELIPHCNKSDKASMLDEAIEYLKSLQLQVQFMWMGSGMAPMMFPGVQQYMSRMGIGMGHASMPSINSPTHVQRAPLVNQSLPSTTSTSQMPMCPPQSLSPANFPTQMQNVHLPESYAHYLGFPSHMQLPPQTMNLYPLGSHMMQQNQAAGAAGGSSLPTAGVHNEHNQNGQSG